MKSLTQRRKDARENDDEESNLVPRRAGETLRKPL
jgi:hypothetical protein